MRVNDSIRLDEEDIREIIVNSFAVSKYGDFRTDQVTLSKSSAGFWASVNCNDEQSDTQPVQPGKPAYPKRSEVAIFNVIDHINGRATVEQDQPYYTYKSAVYDLETAYICMEEDLQDG